MEKKNHLLTLGLKVKQARKAKRLTQTELAYRIGKDHPSINRVEKGKINPSYIFLLEICEGLEISLPDLLNFY